ncbi:hypothetical protein QNO07_09170 [Streptomyces sp. 549]|uniref:hypothetical protein n=1 Tax=Streptomyces sp. 549 TaxID=3049076 RepID=UPI0024C43111|nr:hypothetical protein [Streptomyces sp. 549]MDK1473588.1 hypothetical protein [Streptomyces sp. 549]
MRPRRRSDKLLETARHLAPQGDNPALNAAVTAYIHEAQRDLDRLTNPPARRAADWYMSLPHNRLAFGPLWYWLMRHKKITFPAVGALYVAVIVLGVQPWR